MQQQVHAGLRAAEPMFPSLGSTMGGVATHSYVVSDGAPASAGSLGPPVTYISFPHATATSAGHMPTPMLEEVRTIFVTGFPDNVHERELHNLCRFIPGYEASQVAFKPNQQPQVFVLFTTAAHARQAIDALAGLPFDVQPAGSREGGRGHGADNNTSAVTSSSSVSATTGLAPRPSPPGTVATAGGATVSGAPGSTGAEQPAGGAAAGQEGLPSRGSGGNNDPNAVGAAVAGAAGAGGALPTRLGNFVNARTSLLAAGGQPMLGGAGPSATSGMSLNSNGSMATGSHGVMASGPPVRYHLRCEMAHKNLYIKEGDASVRQPHRRIVLHNNPGAVTLTQATLAGMNSSGAVTHVAVAGHAPGSTGLTAAPGPTGAPLYAMHDLPVYTTAAGGAGAAGTGSGTPGSAVAVHPLAANAAGLPTPLGGVHAHQQVPLGTPLGFLPVTNRGDNPPCNTLFIGNLSDQVSELELLHLLSSQPGYKQMKLVRGPRQQVSCFVEFEDTLSATAVHNNYQGAVLASSDRGGIRIQYSKNPFGKRSSLPGSNASTVLRSTVGLSGSGDLTSSVAAATAAAGAGAGWPMVYHTVQQPTPGASMAYY